MSKRRRSIDFDPSDDPLSRTMKRPPQKFLSAVREGWLKMTSRTNQNVHNQHRLSPEQRIRRVIENAAEYDILSDDDKKEILKLIYK